jgi:cytochrome c553
MPDVRFVRRAWTRGAWLALGLMGAGSVPAGAGDPAFGEYLSGECVTCHRRTGEASGIPSITGWPQDAFKAVMDSYRRKERDNAIMQTIAGRLSDEEIEALAAYFESLGLPQGK